MHDTLIMSVLRFNFLKKKTGTAPLVYPENGTSMSPSCPFGQWCRNRPSLGVRNLYMDSMRHFSNNGEKTSHYFVFFLFLLKKRTRI